MIDWHRIQELRDEIGHEDFAEVAEMFLTEVDGAVDQLRTAPSLPSLHEDLHFLKGSALNLGFAHFATLCEAGEAEARDGDPANVDLPMILAAYDSSRSAFVASPLVAGGA